MSKTTGAIVNFAEVNPMPKAGNRWNIFDVTARGDHVVVFLNGQQTVNMRNGKFRSGPIALQNGGGIIRWRTVDLRLL